MFKLLTTITLTTLSVFALPAAAAAQDNPCPDGYVSVMSNGGPLCVNPIYLDGTWNDHPAECWNGYYQGSCAPVLEPVVLPDEAYTFQMDPPVIEAVAAPTVVEIVAVVFGWLTPVELDLADLGATR